MYERLFGSTTTELTGPPPISVAMSIPQDRRLRSSDWLVHISLEVLYQRVIWFNVLGNEFFDSIHICEEQGEPHDSRLSFAVETDEPETEEVDWTYHLNVRPFLIMVQAPEVVASYTVAAATFRPTSLLAIHLSSCQDQRMEFLRGTTSFIRARMNKALRFSVRRPVADLYRRDVQCCPCPAR